MYKISIIIPVFNAEKTIKRCMNSIINQSIGFENLEVILVNDCSADNSAKIIEEYCSEYPNITLINSKINNGPGISRNMGIEKSTSPFIMFIDNDDEYDSEICEKLYNTINQKNCDIVSCNYIIFNEITKYKRKSGLKFDTSNPTTEIKFPEIIYCKDIFVWDKIFKKKTLIKNNISFHKELSEDAQFCTEYFINSKKLIHINNYFGYTHYDHYNNLTSVSLEYNLKLTDTYFEILKILKKSSVDINFNKMFYKNIEASIERSILMKESEIKSIKKFFRKLNTFEKTVNFENKYITNPLIRIINKMILKNHITLSSIIIRLIKLFSNNAFLKNSYRKLFHQNLK